MDPSEIEIAIYTPRLSTRLEYILSTIFEERLKTKFTCYSCLEKWLSAPGKKINYSNEELSEGLQIKPAGLLFEENIRPQALNVNRWKKQFVLFYNQPAAIIPFDLFAAAFFLLSRYEEYLEFDTDRHLRFPAKASVAAQYAFLQQPVVDIWIRHLASILGLDFPSKSNVALTADIDLLWKYQHKSNWRTWAGIFRDFIAFRWPKLRERRLVQNGKKNDPFDVFDWMEAQAGKPLLYFVLCGGDTKYDRNTPATHPAFQQKIKKIASKNELGIHPSYDAQTMRKIVFEKKNLEQILNQTVDRSRQHFIKLALPKTYQELVQAGISEDYTMGYPDANGFRAGTSMPFYWFDMSENKATSLRVHPFVYMDASSVFYLRQNEQEELHEIERLARSIKENGGTFCGIWHNYLLGDELQYPGRKRRYTQTLTILEDVFGRDFSA